MELLVVGLDAATWSIAEPLMCSGAMDTLASLVADGFRAPLLSTDPPITPPAWTTLITGMDPARHGVLSFCRPDRSTGLVVSTSGADRRVRTMFDYLADGGVSCGAVNIPWTYPADAGEGFAVSGFDAPTLDERAVRPAGSLNVLRRAAPEYSLQAYHGGPVEPALEQIRQKTEAIVALHRWRPVVVLFAVLMETDTVAHVSWPDGGDVPVGHPLARVYRAVDEALARLIDELGPDAVAVVSDHGMGPCHSLVNLSRPLFRAGLMRQGGSLAQKTVLPLYRAARRLYRRLRPPVKGPADAVGVGHISRWAPRVDWRGSDAHTGVGFGWVTVPSDEHIDRAIEAVMSASSRQDPPPIAGVTRHDGSPDVPELLFSVDVDAGYWMGPPILDAAEPFLIRDPRHPAFQAAGHRREGMFVLAGKGVASGQADRPVPARDVAPTLMYLAGGDIPEGLDGAPYTPALDAAALEARPPTFRPMPLQREPVHPSGDDADREAVERRLRGLGYLE